MCSLVVLISSFHTDKRSLVAFRTREFTAWDADGKGSVMSAVLRWALGLFLELFEDLLWEIFLVEFF
jgi:hypothetical protein